MADETALTVPTGPDAATLGTLALTNPTALKAQLDGYTAARKLFLEWLFDALTAGTDYMLLHRKLGRKPNQRDCSKKADRTGRRCTECGAKATLCKPGSEKITGLLQLRPTFRRDLETWEMLGSPVGTIALVCELRNTQDAIVAEGRGVRAQEMDYGDVNKTIKMVQKSAQTDAVLRCAGLSEVFTLDLEDMATVDGGFPEKPGIVRPRAKDAPKEAMHDGGGAVPDRGGVRVDRGDARGPGVVEQASAEGPAAEDMAAEMRDRAQDATRRVVSAVVTPPAEARRAGYVSQAQIALLMATCHRYDVSEQQLTDYLGTLGYESKKDIPVAKLEAVIQWVAAQAGTSHAKVVLRRRPRDRR